MITVHAYGTRKCCSRSARAAGVVCALTVRPLLLRCLFPGLLRLLRAGLTE